jgi:two-component sensor histidine kinase
VLARDGTTLLGPKELLRTRLQTDSAAAAGSGTPGSTVEQWPDGQHYLSGYYQTSGYRDYPGLGWSVLVREQAEVSFAPVGVLQRQIAFWGLLVALSSALLAWLAAGWITRPLRVLTRAAEQLGGSEPVNVPAGVPKEIAQVSHAMATASIQLVAREQGQALLIAELNHRVKNTLATVQAMVTLTARGKLDVSSYRSALEQRLLALSKTHNLLTEACWEAVTLSDLLRNELAPYDNLPGQRVMLDGPAVPLMPRIAVSLGMALHELTTNAAKYGSLSVPDGCLEVHWRTLPGPDGLTRLRLEWVEQGGPMTVTPERLGFGSRLIRQCVAGELGGEVHFGFAGSGLRCTIAIDVGASDTVRAATHAFTHTCQAA